MENYKERKLIAIDLDGTTLQSDGRSISRYTKYIFKLSGNGFTYFGTGDLDTVLDSGGWLVLSSPTGTVAFANPDTTISIKVNKIHKLDDKFINIDPFVRRYDYLLGDEFLIGSRFNAKGYSIDLYKCEKFIRPKRNEMLFGYMSELGFSQILFITDHACFVKAYV